MIKKPEQKPEQFFKLKSDYYAGKSTIQRADNSHN